MKMSRKTVRIITAVMMILMMLSVATTVFAGWTPEGDQSAAGAESIKNIINAVLGWVQIIGIGVAVIMLIVLAIKYISAAPGTWRQSRNQKTCCCICSWCSYIICCFRYSTNH